METEEEGKEEMKEDEEVFKDELINTIILSNRDLKDVTKPNWVKVPLFKVLKKRKE